MRPNIDYFNYFNFFHRIKRIFHALQTVFSAEKDQRLNESSFHRSFISDIHIRIIFGTAYICNSYCIVAVSKDCFIRMFHSTTKFIIMTIYKWDTTQKWAVDNKRNDFEVPKRIQFSLVIIFFSHFFFFFFNFLFFILIS